MTNKECDCGAATEGKWADQHSPNCPAIKIEAKVRELAEYTLRNVKGATGEDFTELAEELQSCCDGFRRAIEEDECSKRALNVIERDF